MVISLKEYKKRRFFDKQKNEIESALEIMYNNLNSLDKPEFYSYHNIRMVISTLKANISALESKLLLRENNGCQRNKETSKGSCDK